MQQSEKVHRSMAWWVVDCVLRLDASCMVVYWRSWCCRASQHVIDESMEDELALARRHVTACHRVHFG